MRNGSKLTTMRTETTPEVTYGCGNIFADLGLPYPEVDMAKAQLIVAISQLMETRKLSQKSAATLFEITPEQLDGLLNGRMTRFSIDRLLKMLNKLGHTIEIRVHPIENRLPNSTFKS